MAGRRACRTRIGAAAAALGGAWRAANGEVALLTKALQVGAVEGRVRVGVSVEARMRAGALHI